MKSKRALLDRLNALYEFVWNRDIPSPCCLEYRELHEKMQEIMKEIESIIDEVKRDED